MFNSFSINECKIKIGEWCKLKRKMQKLSQSELAELLDISRITIQKLESGKNVTIDTLLKVVKHFDELDMLHRKIEEEIKNLSYPSLY